MAQFLLCSEVNASIGRRLRDRGHQITSARDVRLEQGTDSELVRFANAGDLILVTHDARRAASLINAEATPQAGVIVVPQAPHEDIPRISEAIHNLTGTRRPEPKAIYRFGLLSGWGRLDTDAGGAN